MQFLNRLSDEQIIKLVSVYLDLWNEDRGANITVDKIIRKETYVSILVFDEVYEEFIYIKDFDSNFSTYLVPKDEFDNYIRRELYKLFGEEYKNAFYEEFHNRYLKEFEEKENRLNEEIKSFSDDNDLNL